MPIYEYKCGECLAEFESIDLPGQKSSPSCPRCGSSRLERLISTFSAPATRPSAGGLTCCGRESRCSTPPCDEGGACERA